MCDLILPKLKARSDAKAIEANLIKQLRILTAHEKDMLKRIYDNGIANLSISDAAVAKLESQNIILKGHCTSESGRSICEFSYTLQPWALKYFRRYPKMLKQTAKRA